MNALFKIVHTGMTGDVQLMDFHANGGIKTALRRKFNDWYTTKALRWMESGNDVSEFKTDMSWNITQPCHAKWLVTTYSELLDDIMTKSLEPLELNNWDDPVDQEQEEKFF